jgi:hypothetical protein
MGTVATLGIASTGGAAASGDDYEVVEVPPGGRYEKRIGDGETFENTLIDITAEGATYLIYASGSDWTVRNVAVRGVWDEFEKAEPFIALVDDGSTGVIENVYLGDGATDDSYPGSTGIYVGKAHAGTLEIDRVNIQGFPDNAIYASTPGHTDEYDSGTGGGGEVHITNSYAADCRAAHFRIGTDGSYCRNCVAVGGDRGFIGRFQHTEAYDCDFSGGRFGDVVVGAPGWETSDTASVSVENTRYESTNLYWDGNELTGSSAGQPRTEPPAGVPRTPEEAASGSSGSSTAGGSGSDSDSDTDTDEPTLSQTLAVETDEGGPLVEYELVVEGTVAKGNNAEDNDTITEDGDTTTVAGATGNGYTDDYRFDGELVDWSANVDADHYRILVDGEEVEAAVSDEPRTLTVETDEGGPLVRYEFTVDGAVSKGPNAEGGKSIASDTVTEDGDTTIVAGATGNGYTDDYEIRGRVTDWSANVSADAFRLLVDGEERDPSQI